MTVQMEKGARFHYIPHPMVPHQNSSFTTISRIELSEENELLWGEILTCGRKLSGEKFLFRKFHSLTEIYSRKRLIIKDNLLVQPSNVNVAGLGNFEGYSHQATLYYINESTDPLKLVENVRSMLEGKSTIAWGITALQTGVLVRILGQKGEELFELLKAIGEFLTTSEKVIQSQNLLKGSKIYAT